MSNDLLYKVAYDEAVRALSEQQAEIDSFRTRGGMLLSAAAITTSFLGAQTLQGGGSSPFAWLALIDFVAVAAVSLAILWPYRWEFTASYLRNRRGLNLLAFLFQVATSLLASEIVLWIIAIASTS